MAHTLTFCGTVSQNVIFINLNIFLSMHTFFLQTVILYETSK